MPGGGAVRDDGNRFIGRVRRVVLHLDVEHRCQTTESLGSDTERIDPIVQLKTKLFGSILCATLFQFVDVDRLHHRLFRQQHRLFRGSANPDPKDSRRAPSSTHRWDDVKNPVGHRV